MPRGRRICENRRQRPFLS